MTFSEKASFLRNSIVNALTPLISDSYVLWDLPYYTNIALIPQHYYKYNFLST